MLLDALRGRGVPCEHVDDRGIVYVVGGSRPPYRGVLNRALSATRRLEVSRWCEAIATPVVNTTTTVATCDSKIAMSLALSEAGIPLPATAIALDATAGTDAVDEIGVPAVVKPVNGSWGRGVARIRDDDAAEAVFSLREELGSTPAQKLGYVQEFVPGRDLRVLVVGDRAVGAIVRESEHWVRNTARGAQATAYPLDDELVSLAERAAEAVGGGLLGVDLLETDEGERVVLEVNAAPEFHGLASAHPELPIAEMMVDYLLGEISA